MENCERIRAPWFVRNNHILREANIPKLKLFLHETALRSFKKAARHPNLWSEKPSTMSSTRKLHENASDRTGRSLATKLVCDLIPLAAPTDQLTPTFPKRSLHRPLEEDCKSITYYGGNLLGESIAQANCSRIAPM
ncbi:uncharacterized protein LOC135123744 [Zophobas morio]|uniref:uncharacterized protein LOC135123744 n=1 Tax=Zophobas morio TaxID=2755281 RepID=UPI00308381ED